MSETKLRAHHFSVGSGSEATGGEQLNMEQMAGIFIVFAIGIGLGLICMVFEYIFAASSDAFRDRIEGVLLMYFFILERVSIINIIPWVFLFCKKSLHYQKKTGVW